jgi:DNA-binding NtrC family response regulator
MTDRKGRVLLMDSDHDERLTVQTWLKADGWDIGTCASPHDAQLVLKSGEYDILITEIQFSGVKGFPFVDWVLANCPGISIVVVTNAPFSWVSRLGFMRQVQMCLQQPIRREALRKVLLALKDETL